MKNHPKKTIYIDVTSTIKTSNVTGIQRVVQKISTELMGIGRENIVFVKFFPDGRYRKIKINWLRESKSFKGYEKNKNNLISKLIEVIKKYLPNSVKINIKKAVNLKTIFITYLHDIYSKQGSIVRVVDGDTFLMLDATWNYNPWLEIRRIRDEGAKIAHIIYDLLPLKYPQFFTSDLVDSFEIWSKMISYYCSNLYCISYAVKKDVQNLLSPLAGNQFHILEVIPLGSNLATKIKNTKNPAHTSNDNSINFLSVGTIEPRKNYKFILNAFNKIWSIPGNENITWTIVGRIGWNSFKLYSELTNHPEIGQRLRLFNNADDQQLMSLYEESFCVVAASVDEGFGLPIVEALSHKCTVLLSDIDVFREFNFEEDHYFPINDSADLVKKIQSQKDLKTRLNLPKLKCMSWRNAANIFYEKLAS